MKESAPSTLFKRRYLYALTGIIPVMVLVAVLIFTNVQKAKAAGILDINVIVAPNLVVDSNVLSPSTYAPKVATVIGEFCNTGDAPLANVSGYIGDGSTPGTYVSKSNYSPGTTTFDGPVVFTHLGGAADASRYMGTLAPGQCLYQYWSFEYPQTTTSGGSPVPTWGVSVKAEDDLDLQFNIWGSVDGANVSQGDTTMHFRNEISAMANKIKPNGNPAGQWFNTDTSTIYPGETIETNGILYRIGNVNQGFDNDGDGAPDYNLWLQPFGDPAYDPSCFRLIGTTGTLTVTRSAGNPDLIIDITDQLYFTGIPSDNTDVRGVVYYEFLALGGACTIPITPYQEVASGSDNEKFNGDYGTGVPSLMSYEPEVDLLKTAPGTIAEGGTINYSIGFINNSATATAGITLSSGGVNAGLMISDTIPTGLIYIAGSAALGNTVPGSNAFSIRYYDTSTSNWTTVEPAPANVSIIQWWLDEPLDVNGSGNNSGTVTYSASVPGTYIASGGDPFIENCATSHFGDGAPFAESCDTTLVEGTGSIGNRVWRDDNGDGVQDSGETTNIDNVLLSLYWDKNNNKQLDDGDVLVTTQDSGIVTDPDEANSNYNFTNLPNGDYLVVVDQVDPDIDTVARGHTLTTSEVVAVTLSTGNNNENNADFGFGPTLLVSKLLKTPDPAVVNEEVVFTIDLINNRPGDGTENGYCQYTLWSNTVHAQGDGFIPVTGAGNAGFVNPLNAQGRINQIFATSQMANNSNTLGLSGFNTSGKTGNITSVELVAYAQEIENLNNGADVILRVYRNDTQISLDTNTNLIFPDTYFSDSVGSDYQLRADVTSIIATSKGSAVTWDDFVNNVTESQILASKGTGNTTGNLGIDAMAYVVTTDEICGSAYDTIVTLPLTDTYDADILEFVSADPSESTATTTGSSPNTDGTITWDNLGPLFAGGTRTVTVTFRALETTTSATVNNAEVTNAKFVSGRDVNDDSDSDTVEVVASGSITGTVWADTDDSGWDTNLADANGPTPGETGLPGVAVTLYGCFDTYSGELVAPAGSLTKECSDNANGGEWKLIISQQTNNNGSYAFTGLRDGFYDVRVTSTTLPASFTTPTAKADPPTTGAGVVCTTLLPDETCFRLADPATGNLEDFVEIDITNGPADVTEISYGFRNTDGNGGVIGYVWNDINDDGVWDAGEPPIPNVTIYLCNDGSNPCTSATTTTTDANGFYEFSSAAGVNYTIGVTQPSGTNQSGDPDYGAGSCNGDAVNCDNNTNVFTIINHDLSGPYNFGYVGTLSIGDTVYRDWDGDGVEEAGEEGINGVQVELYLDVNRDGVLDSSDILLDTQTTATSGLNDGRYSFDNLPGGGTMYIVKINGTTAPAGHALTGDPTEVGTCVTCDGLHPVTLAAINITTVDFGYQPQGFSTIGDYVWNDSDGDGTQDAGESGIAGVGVTLYQDQNGNGVIDPEDAIAATTTTGGSGDYLFSDLTAGNYIVSIDGTNFNAAQPLEGLTHTNPQSGIADNLHQVALGSSEDYDTADFGYTSSSIGDLIWSDNNGNGEFDGGDTGIPNVVVNLYLDANNDGVPDTPLNSPFATDTTDANGLYLFDGLAPNNYVVIVDRTGVLVPADYTLTGDPNSYNTITPADLSCLSAGAQECDDIYPLRGITAPDGTFFPGLQMGQNDMSADFGYQPQGVVGDTLWVDSNDNGIHDAGEPALTGVPIELQGNGCTPGVNCPTTTTDGSGFYSFGGLLDATSYTIVVDETGLPTNLSQTYDAVGGTGCIDRNAGTAPTGADCSPTTTFVTNFAVSGGIGSIGGNACVDCEMDVDFGYRFVGTNAINGTVWYDSNSDGSIDGGEGDRYQGVTILLWDCGIDGICNNADDIPVATTLTSPIGTYSFPNLANGTYRVSLDIRSRSISGFNATTVTLYNTLVLSGGTTLTRNFGVIGNLDFGDLPNSYNVTSFAVDGARHTVQSANLRLGGAIDNDAGGQEEADAGQNANGDDFDLEGNDDDGVTRIIGDANPSHGGWTNGSVSSSNGGAMSIDIQSDNGWTGVPQLFMDFHDGNGLVEVVLRDNAGTPILTSPSAAGSYNVYFDIPAGTFDGSNPEPIYFRVRLSQNGGLTATGPGGIGEVEDYKWDFGPTAVSMQNIDVSSNTSLAMVLVMVVAMFFGTGLVMFNHNRRRVHINK